MKNIIKIFLMTISLHAITYTMYPNQNSNVGYNYQQIDQQMNQLRTIAQQSHQEVTQQWNQRLMEANDQRSLNMYQLLNHSIPAELISKMPQNEALNAHIYNSNLSLLKK